LKIEGTMHQLRIKKGTKIVFYNNFQLSIFNYQFNIVPLPPQKEESI